MVKKYILEHFGCKYCGIPSVIRYGTENGMQYWLYKKCGHKFADNRASPERKEGILVSPGGVRSIWLRHELQTMEQRLKRLEKEVAKTDNLATGGYLYWYRFA